MHVDAVLTAGIVGAGDRSDWGAFMRRILGLVSAVSALASPAFANDTMAVLKTGGLEFVRSGEITMTDESLFISPDQVRVDYVFTNTADKPVESVVAFPMPDVVGSFEQNIAAGNVDSDNFLDFTVSQDGQPIQPKLQQRVLATNIDVTDDLVAQHIPLLPLSQATGAALDKLPPEVQADWIARGIVMTDEYDQGKGLERHLVPIWTLRSTYWWRTTFPAKASVRVQHRYKPSVGGTVAITFLDDGLPKGETYRTYAQRYCLDESFVKTAQKLAKAAEAGGMNYTESWISYILTTGANWSGPIGHFKLTVDKGDPENYVSFCGTGVKKVGPTTFEMTATDFSPEKDLDILILNAVKPE